jgi:hypothetical protein
MSALTIPELIRAYELWTSILEEHRTGCCFHVTLSDGNYGDDFAKYESDMVDPTHPLCMELRPFMLQMSKTQRKKLAQGGYAPLADNLARKTTP